MRQALVILIALFWAGGIAALSLEECLTNLRQTTPLQENQARVLEQRDYQDKLLQAAYYPSLNLNAELGYNSEVTKMDLGSGLPISAPEPDKDRESLGLELRQLLWDSGTNSLMKEINTFQSQAKTFDVNAAIHLREMETVAVYYQVLSYTESLAIVKLQKDTLRSRLAQIEAAYRMGVREISDVQLVQHDILSIDDKIYTIQMAKQDQDTSFTKPLMDVSADNNFTRAELSKLDALAELQRVSARLATRKNLPQIFARATAGYGKPGYDMFSTQWHDYYSVGLSFSWKIWDFGQRKQESSIARTEADIIEANKANLLISLQNEISALDAEMQELENSILNRQQKVELLMEIVKAYSNKYDSGIITTTELLTQSNNLLSAKLDLQSGQTKLSALEAKRLFVLGGKF
jgi:outer membrane protein TolC